MIATKVEGVGMTYGTPDSYNATLGTMAKLDCYYYYVLPILIKQIMGIVLVGMIMTFVVGFFLGIIVMTDGKDYDGGR